MGSLDVTSLFTNVPLTETINYICQKITESDINIGIPVNALTELLFQRTANVQFRFNGELYRQTDSVAMGSPIGLLIADIFLGKLETDQLDATIQKSAQLLTRLPKLLCLRLNQRCFADHTESIHENLELYASESHMHSNGLFESVGGHRLHFIRTGQGDHNLLLCPAPLGSAMTDYSILLEKLDKSIFTAVAWDPPGQGASIPPLDRSWLNPKRFAEDAELGLNLMRTLKLCPFSILAWSDAIITALMMALNYASQDEITKLMLWALEGSIPYSTKMCIPDRPNRQEWFRKYHDIHEWPMPCRSPLEAIYGLDYLQKQWSDYVEFMKTNQIPESLSMDQWKFQLRNQWNSDNQPRIMLMRSPSWDNTENWLTYLLCVSNQSRIMNWFNDIDNHQPCWGPHKMNSEKFRLLTERFLVRGELFDEIK